MKSLESVVKKALLSLDSDREQPVALAFSGGLDSTVLLDILQRVVGNEKLRAVYVCHNLRPKEELEREISLIKKHVPGEERPAHAGAYQGRGDCGVCKKSGMWH